MKKNIIIYIIAFIPPIYGLSQKIQIIDEETKKVISNVTVYDSDGKIINTSNTIGILELGNHNNIELYHPEYESKIIIDNTSDIIFMTPTIIKLSEVKINKSAKYLHLYSYFYSYQLINNTPQSFIDGIIVFTINSKNNKIINQTILKNRSLYNKSFIKNFYTNNETTKFSSLGITPPPFNFKEELINNKEIKFDNGEIKKLTNNINILEQSNKRIINANYVKPGTTIDRSLFGIKSSIINHNIIETFNTIENTKMQDLSSIQKFYNSKISQKNNTYDYQLIQNIFIIKYIPSNSKIFEEKIIQNNNIEDYYYNIPNSILNLIDNNTLY